MTESSYHVTYAFYSGFTHYSYLNVKEILAQNRRNIWSLSDCNGIRTHNHLVQKRTLNHLAKLISLAKWLSVHLRISWLWIWNCLQNINFFLAWPLHMVCFGKLLIWVLKNSGELFMLRFIYFISNSEKTMKSWTNLNLISLFLFVDLDEI